MSWIDARAGKGIPVEQMNAELHGAGIAPRPPKAGEDVGLGYVANIERIPIRGASNLMALTATLYRRMACDWANHRVLYRRETRRRLAALGATEKDGKWPYGTPIVDAEWQPDGELLVASGCVASNCTSAWNGKRFLIQRLRNGRMETLFATEPQVHFDPEKVRIQRGVVRLRYNMGISNGAFVSLPTVAVYRVNGKQVRRGLPLALTRAGFLEEWLALRGSEFRNKSYGFTTIGRCNTATPVWEVATEFIETQKRLVFRIGGARASQLRMLAVKSKLDPACRAVDDEGSMTAVLPE